MGVFGGVILTSSGAMPQIGIAYLRFDPIVFGTRFESMRRINLEVLRRTMGQDKGDGGSEKRNKVWM